MGFSRQEYWSGVPLPSPSALPKSPLKMQVIEVPFRPIELEWTGAQESVLISLSGACSSWRTQNHLFKLYLYHRASSAQLLNCVQFSVTPWTVACQALLSMGFPRQEYWSRLPFLPPGDLPDPGIKPAPPGGSVVKNLPATLETCRRCRFDPWVRKISWRRKWQPTPVFLPGKCY